MSPKRLYLVVAALAVVVHIGALWNLFALDDRYIILLNPIVRSGTLGHAFAAPYWPPDLGGKLYRPLAIASYVIDRMVDGPVWFHLVNLLWHAAASVAVAVITRRLAGAPAALIAGVLFAVHPVHVEAVANLVGRAELMATLFALLAVYAALVRGSVAWCAVALTLGILSKENAAVAPALIVWAWALGIGRPTRRRALAFVVTWVVLGGAYLGLRWAVLHPYERYRDVALVFVGATPVQIRLTAVAALADVARLLIAPITLRADYSPAERTLVTTPLDLRFVAGALCFAVWMGLLALAWKRRRPIEAFGLGWIGVAFLPTANFLLPIGVLIAERTLYLPSVGLAIVCGAALRGLSLQRLYLLAAAVAVLGGARSALRVPVWRDDNAVLLSVLQDSPRSYYGPFGMGVRLQGFHQPEKALAAFRIAIDLEDRNGLMLVAAADAAFTLGRPQLADTLLQRAERACSRCAGNYRIQANSALARGDTAVADSLLARLRRLASPAPEKVNAHGP